MTPERWHRLKPLFHVAMELPPNERAAAEYYPANYWYSLLQPPPPGDFPGTGNNGNGWAETLKNQGSLLGQIAISGCLSCHQLGTKATRELPTTIGEFKSHFDAWERRIQSGQSGVFMSNSMSRLGRKRALEMFADWTERVAKGELPPVTSTCSPAIMVAVWLSRAVFIEPVSDQEPTAGSKISAVATCVPPSNPPATKTCPLARRVLVWPPLADDMEASRDQLPVAGS